VVQDFERLENADRSPPGAYSDHGFPLTDGVLSASGGLLQPDDRQVPPVADVSENKRKTHARRARTVQILGPRREPLVAGSDLADSAQGVGFRVSQLSSRGHRTAMTPDRFAAPRERQARHLPYIWDAVIVVPGTGRRTSRQRVSGTGSARHQ
jgi:hypothetical protein